MNKITEYKTIGDKSRAELDKSINNWISLGWQPIGGIAFTYSTSMVLFAQSIVKYESNDTTTDN